MAILINIVLPIIIFMTHLMLKVSSTGTSQVTQFCVNTIMDDFGWEKLKKKILNRERRKQVPRFAFMEIVFTNLKTEDGKDYFKYINSVIEAKEKTYNPKQFCVLKVQGLQSKDILTRVQEEQRCCEQLFSKIPDREKPDIHFFTDSTNTTKVIKDTMWNLTESDVRKLGAIDYRYQYFYYLSGQYSFTDFENPKQISDDNVMIPSEFCRVQESAIKWRPNYFEILQTRFKAIRLKRDLEIREESSSSKRVKI